MKSKLHAILIATAMTLSVFSTSSFGAQSSEPDLAQRMLASPSPAWRLLAQAARVPKQCELTRCLARCDKLKGLARKNCRLRCTATCD